MTPGAKPSDRAARVSSFDGSLTGAGLYREVPSFAPATAPPSPPIRAAGPVSSAR